jgi:hypothetical protein
MSVLGTAATALCLLACLLVAARQPWCTVSLRDLCSLLCVQIQELSLANLGLEALPAAIGKLTTLGELCLGRNRLGQQADALPDELTLVRDAASQRRDCEGLLP